MGKATTIGGVGSPGSGIQAPGTLTSVSATDEQTLRWVDKPTALHAVVSAVPAGVSRLPIEITFWIDKGDGKGKIWQGSDLMTSVAQTLYIGSESATNGGVTVDTVHVPTTGVQYPPTDADQMWTLWAAAGKYLSTDAFPAGAVSHSFTMHKSAAPSDAGITEAFAGPSATMGPNSDGIPYWSVPFGFTTPGMGTGGNQNCRGFAVTIDITDVDGNQAPVEQGGGEVLVSEPANDGSAYAPDPFVAGFNPAGSIYTYAVFRVYAPGLDVGDSWNTGTRTLQSIAWNGGAAATSVSVNFGQPPDGRIPGTRIDPDTLGPGVGKDPSTQKLKIKIVGPLYADVAGNVNLALAGDFTVQNGALSQAAVDLAKAVNFNTTNFTKSGGLLAINTLAVNQLIAGTALFAGDVVFARVGGGKVTINSAGVALGSDLGATPAASLTLTPSGATIAKGSNSLAMDATGLTASDASGNSLTLKTEGVRIVRGGTNMLLSVTGMALADANGNTLSMGAGGVVVSRGTSSVTVAASGVTIVNGVLTSPTITGGSLVITTSGGTTTISSATNGLTVTNGSYTSSISGGGFYTTGGITSTGVIAGGGVNVTGSYAGYGVYCPGYGVSCYSLTVGVGGVVVNGAVVVNSARQVACSSLLIGASTAINSSNQFVGFGVNVGTYGVMAGGYGIYGGYYGGTGSFVDQGGTTHQFRGGLILN